MRGLEVSSSAGHAQNECHKLLAAPVRSGKRKSCRPGTHAVRAQALPQQVQQTWQRLVATTQQLSKQAAAVLLSASLCAGSASAADIVGTGECLLQNCKIPLAKCLTDGGCASNLICLNRCNGLPDETECQLRCTQIHENPVVKQFNTCAVTEYGCVKTKFSKPGELSSAGEQQGFGPPPKEALDENFDLEKFEGKYYISAGLNPAFDVFPCQDHYFSSPGKGRMRLALNWRIPDDGKYLERSDIQKFKQAEDDKAHLINDGNEFMNYRDDWYIIASKPNEYLFVLYNGNNDAWKGYGGSTLYSRSPTVPEEYLPEIKAAAARAGLDWYKFERTNNSCPGPDQVELE